MTYMTRHPEAPRVDWYTAPLDGRRLIRIDNAFILADEIIAVTAGREPNPYGEIVDTCGIFLRGGSSLEFTVPAHEVTPIIGWTLPAQEDA